MLGVLESLGLKNALQARQKQEHAVLVRNLEKCCICQCNACKKTKKTNNIYVIFLVLVYSLHILLFLNISTAFLIHSSIPQFLLSLFPNILNKCRDVHNYQFFVVVRSIHFFANPLKLNITILFKISCKPVEMHTVHFCQYIECNKEYSRNLICKMSLEVDSVFKVTGCLG